jgi:hypothetical protein
LRASRLTSSLVVFLLVLSLTASSAQRPPNANAFYQQLRNLTPGSDAVTVSNFELHRDAATFTFRQGTIAFYNDVNGKVTGAVFKGDGHLHITPPIPAERHSLSLMTHAEELDEDFDQVVLRFTDGTAAELHKAASGKASPDSSYARAAQDLQSFARQQEHLALNVDLRLLQDVLSPAPGGFFLAAVHGKKNTREFFFVDPQGVTWLAPEEIAFLQWKWSDEAMSYPLAFHRSAEYANHTASGNEHNEPFRVVHEDLDVSIEKNGFLSSVATVLVRAEQDGVAVVPLDLFATLRVSNVTTDAGDVLDFVQEKKESDPDFGVILLRPLKKGETVTLKITYGGKDVVLDEGQGNYYPVARENWFPNAGQGFGNYATYKMLFHIPKGLQLIATGNKVRESTDGKITTSEWKSDVPLPVVGFSLGDFEMKEQKVGTPLSGQITIDAYANKLPADMFSALSRQVSENPGSEAAIGTLSTLPMLTPEMSQGAAAAEIYTDYFGPLSFDHIALTQQSACNYGQSWPMLVYLPVCGFLDQTQQHALGLRPDDMYWKMVTPHEVAHQWWGHTVGFRSYRDQWMSEGFADASASIFLQSTRPKLDDYLNFWKQERKMITEKNQFGFRPIDVGPLTMGYRVDSPKAGFDIARNLIYPKGAYILQMVRMMMWTPSEGDARFKATMHDFIETNRMQPVTTEDFKAAIERHMSQGMNLGRNNKMDWFFNEYVYGTELPTYHFEGQVTPNDKGASLHFKLVQSGVSPDFKMPVPLYLEFDNGKIQRLGSVIISGDKTIDQTFQLPKLPGNVKKVSINHYYDVLSIEN